MPEPILVIMAAGMGSRFGGPKQIEPLGPHGEILLDYSLYDAWRAGFRRVAFIISRRIEHDFAEALSGKLGGFDEVCSCFQEYPDMPQGREKPLGTGHAVLCARQAVDAPFAVLNADDFYGAGAFSALYNHLSSGGGYCMAGYRLGNTLSESGGVSRGVCEVEGGLLRSITERTSIERRETGVSYCEEGELHALSPEAVVSMNCWGFPLDFMDILAEGFSEFLSDALPKNPLKGEYYLPAAVQLAMRRHGARVSVLPCSASWFGVTYPQDRQGVRASLAELTAAGAYPADIFGAMKK